MNAPKPYPRYKRSGLASPPEIPSHWRVEKVRRLTGMTVGWTPPTGDDTAFTGDNLWANISDLGPRTVTDTAKRISDEAVRASRIRRSPQGSLLFSFKLTVGLVSFAGSDMYTNEAIATFLGSNEVDLRYAFYAFPPFLLENATENIYGAKILNQERIFATRLALPDLGEQQTIANYLDRETAEIDAFISDQEELIELLAERRAATIGHALTKGLDATAALKDSGEGWLGATPEDWILTPFARAVSFREGPGIGAVDFRNEGVPLLRVAGVRNRYATLDGCNFLDPGMVDRVWRRFKIELGELLVSASASMGTVSEAGPEVVGAIPYTGIIRMSPQKHVDRDFLRFFLQSTVFRAQVDRFKTGSTIQHYGPEHLRQMYIPLPGTATQVAIAAHITEVTAEIDAAVTDAREAIALSRERRAALISAAVTGKIDVRDAA